MHKCDLIFFAWKSYFPSFCQWCPVHCSRGTFPLRLLTHTSKSLNLIPLLLLFARNRWLRRDDSEGKTGCNEPHMGLPGECVLFSAN